MKTRAYRGFDITQVGDHFEAQRAGLCYAKCNTAWGCIVWIDEFCAP